MKERGWMEPIVERVVGQALDSHVAQLRSEVFRRVAEEMESELAAASAAAPGTNSADLARAVAGIQLGTSQREILRALLEGCGPYAARIALFVVKGGQATAWQGCGFRNSEALKDFRLNTGAPAVSRALHERAVVSAQAADLDTHFFERFGAPASGEARVLPLLLKDKVAALVYADGGADSAGVLDAGAVEVLVLATSAWLEVNSLRKQANKELAGETSETPRAATAAPAYADPFAAHTPGHALAAAANSSGATATASASAAVTPPPFEKEHEGAAGEVEVPASEPFSAPSPTVADKGAEGVAAAPAPATSPDQETQRKAQRFARLLVDEIKLYNQVKVSEGRKNKDLYDRLKETIEKSRATYQKRYGNTVAASAKYFEDELIRSLAEDDVSIMGANFPH